MTSATANEIVGLIRRHRLDLSNEKSTQQQLADIFKIHGVVFEREKMLDAEDIVDFLVQGGIAVEVNCTEPRRWTCSANSSAMPLTTR